MAMLGGERESRKDRLRLAAMTHSNCEESPAFSRGESSIGILFVLIFVQLLPGPLFASRNDWSGPSGMDFLFPRRWRLVEMGHNYMAYSLRPRICRLGHLVSAYVFLTILDRKSVV